MSERGFFPALAQRLFLSAVKPLATHPLLITQVKIWGNQTQTLDQISVHVSSMRSGGYQFGHFGSRPAVEMVSQWLGSTADGSPSQWRELGGNFYLAQLLLLGLLASSAAGAGAGGCLASWLNKPQRFLPELVKSSLFRCLVPPSSMGSKQQLGCFCISSAEVRSVVLP